MRSIVVQEVDVSVSVCDEIDSDFFIGLFYF